MKKLVDIGRLVITWHPATDWSIILDAPCGCKLFSCGAFDIEWLGDECLAMKDDVEETDV